MFIFEWLEQEKEGIECKFGFSKSRNEQNLYTCLIENQQKIENHIVKLKEGQHLQGLNRYNVNKVRFVNCRLTRVPSGLKDLFPNFYALHILGSDINHITNEDLNEYIDLEEFVCADSKIDYLPGDLFNNFYNIKHIDFSYNKITFIEPNILDGLNELKLVNLKNIPYYSRCYSLFGPTLNLKELKTCLYDRMYTKYAPLDDLRNSEKKLKVDNQILTDLKAELELKILQFENSEKAFNNQVNQLKTSNEILKKENGQLKHSKNILQSQLQSRKAPIKNLTKEIEQLKINELKLKDQNKSFKQIQSSLCTDLKAFIQDEKTKDFKITIEGQEFSVHKFLLAARSPTLAEILKNNPEVENLNLVDISVEIFEIILKFLYTDEFPVNDGTNFLQLFAAAGKLRITKLVEHAAGNLIDQVDNENALEFLRLSVSFKLPDLKLKAFKLLKKKFSDIKFEDKWLENSDKLIKVVTMLKKKEEMLKKFEDEFKEVTAIK